MVRERIFTIHLGSIWSSEPCECTIYGNWQIKYIKPKNVGKIYDYYMILRISYLFIPNVSFCDFFQLLSWLLKNYLFYWPFQILAFRFSIVSNCFFGISLSLPINAVKALNFPLDACWVYPISFHIQNFTFFFLNCQDHF